MKKYTLETLRPLNQSYDYDHMLTQSDVDMANDRIVIIQSSRDDNTPQPGDIIQYTTKRGDKYDHAHIESVNNDSCYICTMPMIPFVIVDDNQIRCSTSGGIWCNVPRDGVSYIGKAEKLFKDWGRYGAQANGAVCFLAEVNVWLHCSVLDEIFSNGATKLSRRDLESLPAPFCTDNVTDEQMQNIVDETEAAMLQIYGKDYDIDDEDTSDTWWREMENSVIRHKIPYYEDLPEKE